MENEKQSTLALEAFTLESACLPRAWDKVERAGQNVQSVMYDRAGHWSEPPSIDWYRLTSRQQCCSGKVKSRWYIANCWGTHQRPFWSCQESILSCSGPPSISYMHGGFSGKYISKVSSANPGYLPHPTIKDISAPGKGGSSIHICCPSANPAWPTPPSISLYLLMVEALGKGY